VRWKTTEDCDLIDERRLNIDGNIAMMCLAPRMVGTIFFGMGQPEPMAPSIAASGKQSAALITEKP